MPEAQGWASGKIEPPIKDWENARGPPLGRLKNCPLFFAKTRGFFLVIVPPWASGSYVGVNPNISQRPNLGRSEVAGHANFLPEAQGWASGIW